MGFDDNRLQTFKTRSASAGAQMQCGTPPIPRMKQIKRINRNGKARDGF
jgi:hypothetical protein